VDVLVNNAGFAIFDSIAEAKPEELRAMMDTNYFGALHCTQAVLPRMLARGDGAIVNVASITGIMGFARMGGYCATKFAIIGMTEALRDEVLGRGVRVALVCPGTTETEFFAKAERGKMPAASRLILAVKPERVARAVCDAAEDGAYRRILPLFARIYMRFKELSPRVAHFFMRRVSRVMEKP
jgi:short-subunit dehydrogenase